MHSNGVVWVKETVWSGLSCCLFFTLQFRKYHTKRKVGMLERFSSGTFYHFAAQASSIRPRSPKVISTVSHKTYK